MPFRSRPVVARPARTIQATLAGAPPSLGSRGRAAGRRWWGAALAAALLFPAVASAKIVIERPEIRATFAGQPTGAAYMVVRNTGPKADRLVAVECGCASSVMAHRTETSGGVSRMIMEGEVEIPAHGQVAFAPGGRHLMLTGLNGALPAGSRTPMTLTFARAGKVGATFVARTDPGSAPSAPPAHHTH